MKRGMRGKEKGKERKGEGGKKRIGEGRGKERGETRGSIWQKVRQHPLKKH